ncbi:unnamed protein product [Parnassius apollo]|uniref:(apollo) hypothetical protein n=1 Tax=Parnassius apollo TaxID=110799 RepID=A0A8S3WTW4_PARAO|nr:unnamed protein product [Parnassius apollo]
MEISILSSNSDDSDLDVLAQLSDWGADSDAEDRNRASSRKIRRVNYMQSLRLGLAQCDAGLFGNRWMLGDSAYPNRPYLLTPIINPATEAEQRYNEVHIKTRNVIERTFGVWKRHFPVVALTLCLSLPKVQELIIATAVLHNICRNHNLEKVPTEVELPTAEINDEVYYTEGQDVSERAALINNYCR